MAKKKPPVTDNAKAMAIWNKAEDLRIEALLKEHGFEDIDLSKFDASEIYGFIFNEGEPK